MDRFLEGCGGSEGGGRSLRFCWRGWWLLVLVKEDGNFRTRAQAEEGAPLPTYVYVGVRSLVGSQSGHVTRLAHSSGSQQKCAKTNVLFARPID